MTLVDLRDLEDTQMPRSGDERSVVTASRRVFAGMSR
jgi:hypothetical protein